MATETVELPPGNWAGGKFEDGVYNIIPFVCAQNALAVKDASLTGGAPVLLAENDGSEEQKWLLKWKTDDLYRIFVEGNKNLNLTYDVLSKRINTGPVEQYWVIGKVGGDGLRFTLRPKDSTGEGVQVNGLSPGAPLALVPYHGGKVLGTHFILQNIKSD